MSRANLFRIFMSLKSAVKENINKILKKKSLTVYKVSKKIKEKDSALYAMVNGRAKFSKKFIKKLLPILEVSEEEFNIWLIADKYPLEAFELAVKNRKEFPYKRKRLFTTKIDDILKEKDMSRTALATQIKYGQSTLNKMITGKRNVSKPVLEKISNALEIPPNELLSWIIADKYSLELLEAVLKEKLPQK